ncbi:MAG: Thiol:disulfide interchange protein TlpA [Flavobacterium sp. SCGC AAA160-P02]|nr:MAG: Thiol:disulfide interchange protein TlpA [Flavobacterium sp. SCGC AAA160-P02]
MRKIGLLTFLILILCSCEPEHHKDFITFSGKIENTRDSIMTIFGKGIQKTIKISEDGSFKDTLKVKEPQFYSLYSPSSGKGAVFLKNGYHLNLTGDANSFFKSFRYHGNDEGADTNNLIIDQFVFGKTVGNIEGFISLEKEGFLNKINSFKYGMDSISNQYSNADQDIVQQSENQNNTFFKNLIDNYDRLHASIMVRERLKKGNPAPDFSNYENHEGGTKSLRDFRGKYVYIDVWATWCMPCIVQFPYLKKLKEEYKNKNIVFVGISTDDDRRSNGSWKKAHDKWKKMVRQKNLSGIQLWAGKDDARFSKEYAIRGIPRFILIDPKGNIVNSNAVKPSDPSIQTILNNLPGI